MRAELSRLRFLVPALSLRGRPYRVTGLVTDVADFRKHLAAGNIAAAVADYLGRILPSSASPEVQPQRDLLHREIRSAVLGSPQAATVLHFANSPFGRDDLLICRHAADLADRPPCPLSTITRPPWNAIREPRSGCYGESGRLTVPAHGGRCPIPEHVTVITLSQTLPQPFASHCGCGRGSTRSRSLRPAATCQPFTEIARSTAEGVELALDAAHQASELNFAGADKRCANGTAGT